jgi:hypothetical protein
LVNLLHDDSSELDMLVWLSRVSLELIGQAGIGISFDTLSETSPLDEYMLAAKQLMCVFLFIYFSLSWLLRGIILMSESDHFRFLSKHS